MSNVLIIKGHPLTAKESRTLQGLETFITTYTEKNPQDNLEIVDVFHDYIPELDETLLSAWTALRSGTEFTALASEQQKAVSRFNELTEKFLAADKLVIANPMWNLNLPTKVKAWIDTFMVAGKTFRYTQEGPVGMISNKKALHIQSNGGVYGGTDPGSLYLNGVLSFVGVEEIKGAFIEGLDHDPEHADELLEKALENIKQLALEF